MNDDAPNQTAPDTVVVETKPRSAWQPFTPRGVAAFAQAPLSRILFLETVIALLAAAVVIWFLYTNYCPSISEAIENLPDNASIQNGGLTNVPSRILTEKSFLSAVVDLEETGQTGRIADLQLELRQNYFQICSLLGCGAFEYPKEKISIGRSSAEPWWGARQPVILAICGAVAFIQIFLSWILLALIYAPVVKLIAYFVNRELSWRGSWLLASAAQMTGALLMSFSIFLYGVHAFDLIRFMFFFVLHFVIAWIYLGSAPFFLPNILVKNSDGKNPFGLG